MFNLEQYCGVLLYLIAVNLVAFLLMGLDKSYAIKHHYRISEKILLSLALFGGAFGIWVGMNRFHHKTKKPLFMFGVPLLVGLELLVLCLGCLS